MRAGGARDAFADRLCGASSGVVDDFVVRRNDGAFAYNLAVVVDDADQGIGEVVRGADLLDSTPRQLWLRDLLGLPAPGLRARAAAARPGGARLSKRDGAITLAERLALGESPPTCARCWRRRSASLARAGEAPSPATLVERVRALMTLELQHEHA